MKRSVFLLLSIFFVASCTDTAIETGEVELAVEDDFSKIIVVRHAEKEKGDDPGLTEAGKKRAQELAFIAQTEGIEVIFTSHYKRTVDTARPSSSLLGVPITQYEINRSNMLEYPEILASIIRSDYKGKSALIVTHSNLMLPIVSQFVADSNMVEIDESEYSRIATIYLSGSRSSLVMGEFGQ